MSQLGLGLGLSNVSSLLRFSPLDLDPYLLFDTQSSMIGTLENPTLDLDPANPETLDVITATRAGVATYTDADGLIQSASPNTTRVDYTQGAELTPTKFQQLEQTDFSLWAHARTSGTANAAISPDGQNNATYVEQNAGQTNAGSIYRFDAAVTGVFTLSVYAKKKEKDFVVLYDSNVGRTYFNLDTGTVGTVASGNTANIEDAGNGWFRCSTTFTASSGGVKAFYVGDNDNNSVVTDGGGIYVWGPQLEEGTTATTFVENTTGSPKFTGISATYAARVPMVLIEPSATNLLPYSEDFSNPDWTKSAILIDSNQTEAPNGSIVADKLMEEGVNQTHLVFKAGITDLGTISVYAKQGDANNRLFQIRRDGGSNSWSWFDLQAGTVEYQTQGVASIEDAGNGWHRCTFTPTNSNGTVVFGLSNGGLTRGESYEGDGTSGVYIWGAQLETGSVATSLIPTAGGNAAARTRAADDLQIERDSTNLLTNSEDFSSGGWNITNGTLTPNYAISPEGVQNGSKINFSAGGEIVRTTNFTAGQSYTFSFYAKVESGTFDFTYGNIDYTLVSGTATTEWQRFEVTQTAPVATRYPKIDAIDTGDLLIWGAQVEAGSLTSYIPTSGAAASRTTFSDFYNQSEGTFYVESELQRATEASFQPFLFSADNGDANRLGLYYESGGGVRGFVKASNVEHQLSLGTHPAVDTLSRTAFSYKTNNLRGSRDGSSVTPLTTAVIPTTVSKLDIGSHLLKYTHLYFNGHIKRLIYWPYHSDSL